MKNIDSTYVAIGASWLPRDDPWHRDGGPPITFNLCPFTLTSDMGRPLIEMRPLDAQNQKAQ
jgi:hypothetical protein